MILINDEAISVSYLDAILDNDTDKILEIEEAQDDYTDELVEFNKDLLSN